MGGYQKLIKSVYRELKDDKQACKSLSFILFYLEKEWYCTCSLFLFLFSLFSFYLRKLVYVRIRKKKKKVGRCWLVFVNSKSGVGGWGW